VPPARFSLSLSASDGAAAPQEPKGWNAEMEGLILALSKQEDGPRVKTAEELQVWALIDMMVQSKLLVSRATRADSK